MMPQVHMDFHEQGANNNYFFNARDYLKKL